MSWIITYCEIAAAGCTSLAMTLLRRMIAWMNNYDYGDAKRLDSLIESGNYGGQEAGV